ncbi:amphi-Trp domain-containing protein [Natrinema amylolyticum]|uniref:amphi-Trp domain-containing protein n=1 Tax=Natrinema amylolyticum TaxID=2878679 RepID=UPI001CFB4CD5|nr:amphi-Trp domain-containing protein [Natrinema amylolyticum]
MSDSPDDTDRPEESDAVDGDEFELERAYDRAELAAVFREFATAFESGRPVRLNGEDRTVRIAVPERVVAEFEAECDSDAEPPVGELEVELEWDDPDGSSVRVSDLDSSAESTESAESSETASVDESAERGAEADSADVDPAAAVMPLEGIADRGDGEGEDAGETDETAVTADEEADATADRTADSGRTSRFEVYEDKGGQWRWRLVHWNGNIVADSGEGYSSRSNAERAARSVMRSAPTASIQRLE